MRTNQILMRSGILLLLMLSVAALLPAQEEKEMTKDEWNAQMAEQQTKITELQGQQAKLKTETDSLNAVSAKLDADVRACEDALYATLGVTRADVEAYDKELTDMEGRVAELQRMSDAELLTHKDELDRMNARLGEMSKSKIAMIPRYGQRVATLQEKVDGMTKSLSKEKTYTVGSWSRNRDCLWNIAKKKDIYANPWMWPKIWQGNRDKIQDPDRIQPKWVLKIPEGKELSKSDKSAANSYYRKKASAPTN